MPFYAAFVSPDGSLAALHTFSPLPHDSSSEVSPSTTVPVSSSSSCDTSAPVAEEPKSSDEPQPLLLLASGQMSSGNQGSLYRAHCANAPFPLVAKYSRSSSRQYKMVVDEANFYRKHGQTMVEEEVAPRFVGAWKAGRGKESPYKTGQPVAILLMEEWGRSVSDWYHLSREERRAAARSSSFPHRSHPYTSDERRHAVKDVAVRFHVKLGLCHNSLRDNNFVWRREIGASSFRLIDFARSDDNCQCYDYPCDELSQLASSMAHADIDELVEAERDRKRLMESLACVGEEERRMVEQARMEAQLAA